VVRAGPSGGLLTSRWLLPFVYCSAHAALLNAIGAHVGGVSVASGRQRAGHATPASVPEGSPRRALDRHARRRCTQNAAEAEVTIAVRGRTGGDALRIGQDAQLLRGRWRPGPARLDGRRAPANRPPRRAGSASLSPTGSTPRVVCTGSTTSGAFFSRDVAAFANAAGGIIAIGLQTKKVRGQDVIRSSRCSTAGLHPRQAPRGPEQPCLPAPVGLPSGAIQTPGSS